MTNQSIPGLNRIKNILSQEFPYEWTQPPDVTKGVLTTNQAFVIAKDTGVSPVEAAKQIQTKLQDFINTNNLILDVKTIGPYVNIVLSNNYLQNFFVNSQSEIQLTPKPPTFLEYFSPNVGKRMHIGHMRSANIGEAMRRICSLSSTVITNNHLADWGVQFGILIYGVLNLPQLKLGFTKIDWEKDDNSTIVEKLHKVYVATNSLIDNDESIRDSAKEITTTLEKNITQEKNNNSEIYSIWYNIIAATNLNYSAAESYFNLNQTSNTTIENISTEVAQNLQDKFGVWQINTSHKPGQFDLVIGESFYQHFLDEIHYWVQEGIAIQEGESIYIDLEQYNLGRCYLITSQGYSIYAARDILARFVWAGLFQTPSVATFADNRQNHSFKQVFTCIQLIIDSKIYQKKNFATLTKDQTSKALSILSANLPRHISFGFISLPEGTMSSRKGNVVLLQDFIKSIETQVKANLETKSKKELRSIADNQKIQKISTAVIKWYDLSRDREQDYVFDINQAVQFEGNTGIYQLYTIARLKNILRKNETTAQLVSNSINLLNKSELEILQKMTTLELILENITENYKPHHLCNYLSEFTSMINSWYAKYSVATEENDSRRDTLLHMVNKIISQLEFSLDLLGIEVVQSL
ncbi:arginine--tRNA ligase [Candidatus Gracilibacteria bacterium]|nr:arginine--tRNA ligase [Candidatus Gracilibacteria bacterium]